ncbi:MAG: hypothetical protein ABJE95_26030 [Byssovorax sp.]
MLAAFLDGPQAESFGKAPPTQGALGTPVAIAVVIIAVLQTHLHVERTAEGQSGALMRSTRCDAGR